MSPSATYWIEKLQLARHIEGGSFKEIYRSGITLQRDVLPIQCKGDRNISTSIYFMLEQGQFSAFHRIASDEQWHFYYGGTLIVYEIEAGGNLVEHRLGNDPLVAQDTFQCVIKAGSWFASKPAPDAPYCLAGCTVAPGFDFDDFELAERSELVEKFPNYKDLITSLTR